MVYGLAAPHRGVDRVAIPDVAVEDADFVMRDGAGLFGRPAKRVHGLPRIGETADEALSDIARAAGDEHGHQPASVRAKRIAGLAQTAR